MATVASNDMTIVDAAKLQTKDGEMIAVAEILMEQNGLHQDLEWVQGDTAQGHLSGQRTSEPDISDKIANEGVASSKGTVVQVTERPMTIEGWSKIEDSVARYGGNVAAKRADQDATFASAMTKTLNSRLLYANKITPGQISGLITRFNAKSGVDTGRNVLLADGVGAGDLASILLIGHGRGKVYGWYPPGYPAGLEMEDFGRKHQTISGKEIVHYVKRYTQTFGLAIDDWRYFVRIANIDLSNLAGVSPTDLILKMQQAIELLPDTENCRPAFYTTRTVKAWLNRQYYTGVRTGGGLNFENVQGRRMLTFQGIPVNTLDRMSENEGLVA